RVVSCARNRDRQPEADAVFGSFHAYAVVSTSVCTHEHVLAPGVINLSLYYLNYPSVTPIYLSGGRGLYSPTFQDDCHVRLFVRARAVAYQRRWPWSAVHCRARSKGSRAWSRNAR